MSQLRLTVKMAKELKIAELGFPSDSHPKLYDDWYWDITRILRRKVFIFMHFVSFFVFACFKSFNNVYRRLTDV
jgi:hypothetical protein